MLASFLAEFEAYGGKPYKAIDSSSAKDVWKARAGGSRLPAMAEQPPPASNDSGMTVAEQPPPASNATQSVAGVAVLEEPSEELERTYTIGGTDITKEALAAPLFSFPKLLYCSRLAGLTILLCTAVAWLVSPFYCVHRQRFI